MVESIKNICRREFLEGKLNPDGNLPQVMLELDGLQHFSMPTDLRMLTVHDEKREAIGSIELSIPRDSSNGFANIDFIYLKRKGFGKSTYLELLKYLDNTKLRSGALNPTTQHIWEWLVGNGIAKRLSGPDLVFETI